jgi:hypothetical protein
VPEIVPPSGGTGHAPLHRYLTVAPIVGGIVWVAANVLSNHVL